MQQKFKSYLLLGVLASTLALSGCAVSSSNDVMKPGERKGGFLGLAKVANILVDNPKAFTKQPDKVIIGSFKVAFLTENKSVASTRGMGARGHASAVVHLKGLTTAEMQKVTNTLYQQFINDLQAKGYVVMTKEELAAVPEYAALQDLGTPSPVEAVTANIALEGKGSYLAPEGMKVIFYTGEKKMMFDMSVAAIQKSQALSDKTGAAVLAVHYVVNYINSDKYSGMTASIKVGQGISIAPGSGILYFKDKNTYAAGIKLGQAVYSEDEFASVEKITSAAAKTLGTALNVASALMGGATSQSEEYNFTITSADDYIKAATGAGNKATGKLIDKLAENRAVAAVAPQQ